MEAEAEAEENGEAARFVGSVIGSSHFSACIFVRLISGCHTHYAGIITATQGVIGCCERTPPLSDCSHPFIHSFVPYVRTSSVQFYIVLYAYVHTYTYIYSSIYT